MNTTKTEKLDAAMGSHWRKDGTTYFFDHWILEGIYVTIFTDIEKINFPAPDTLVKLSEFTKVKVENGITKPAAAPGIITQTDTLKLLKDTLLQNIEKVKTDKSYIPQAKSINESVGKLVDLAKVEVDYKKLKA